MIIKLLRSVVDFEKNKLETIDLPGVVVPDIPDIPAEETVPEVYTAFAATYARDTMTDEQKNGLAKFLYKLEKH